VTFYHVRLSVEGERHDEVKTDVSEDTLERQFLAPYRGGESITINGKTIPLESVTRIRVSMSEDPIATIIDRLKAEDRSSPSIVVGGASYAWKAAARATDVTDQFITGPPGTENDSPVRSASLSDNDAVGSVGDSNSVFIVTGRDTAASASLIAVLRSLGLRIIEWEQAVAKTGLPSPYTGDVVKTGLRMAAAAVVILTPDDLVVLRPDLLRDGDDLDEREMRGQARPNVYYEAGIADAIGRERTVIVEIGNPKPFSDAAGRHVVRYDGSAGKRNALAERLRVAGLVVDTTGEDWLSVGALDASLEAAAKAIEVVANTPSTPEVDLAEAISQLDTLIQSYESMKETSEYEDLSDMKEESLGLVMRAQAILDRVAPKSSYANEASKVANDPPHVRIPILVAALRALRSELVD